MTVNLFLLIDPSERIRRYSYVNAARPVPDGEVFTLSVRRQEYLMKVIIYGFRCSAVGRTLIRQGSVS